MAGTNSFFGGASGPGKNFKVSAANPPPVTSTSGTGTNANQVQGTGAANAATSGNPVRIGASDGINTQNISTINGAIAAGAAGTGVLAVEQTGNSFAEITTAATTVVKATPGILHKVVINTPAAGGTIKIYNATTATGTPITITSPATGALPLELNYDAYFSVAITVVTSLANDITVTYR